MRITVDCDPREDGRMVAGILRGAFYDSRLPALFYINEVATNVKTEEVNPNRVKVIIVKVNTKDMKASL